MIRLATFILLTSVLLACEPAAVEVLPEVEPKLAVFSTAEDGKPWSVVVSHTIPMFRHKVFPEGIADAAVKIFDGDDLVEQLSCKCDIDLFDTVASYTGIAGGPIAGHTYRMEVAAPGYKTAVAEYTQPEVIEIIDFKAELIAQRTIQAEPWHNHQEDYAIEITFKDPPGENFYNFTMVGRRDKNSGEERLVTPIGNALYEYQTDETRMGTFIDDKNFDGQQVTLKFNVTLYTIISSRFDPVTGQYTLEKDTFATPYLTFLLRHMSKGLHEYNKFAIRKSLYPPESESIIYNNNITNGIGVFGGYTTSRREWEYDPY